jgi:hypoxanthine phosphoribosyltransferase
LLVKPEALQDRIKVDYVGFSIPNDFIVGYGLDYDGLGRNLQEIFVIKP